MLCTRVTWIEVFLDKLTVVKLFRLLKSCWIQRLSVLFTRTCHWVIFWATNSICFTFTYVYEISYNIITLSIPRSAVWCFVVSVSPTKILYAFFHASHLCHLLRVFNFLACITLIKSLVMYFSQCNCYYLSRKTTNSAAFPKFEISLQTLRTS
jgi:hypothetical protein